MAAADGGGEPDFHIALVAVDDADAPIGLAHVLFHRSTWSPTWYCYLEDLFVDPARRKAGAGRALIEAIYREADARGCSRTYWVTQEFNYDGAHPLRPVATKSPFVQYRRSGRRSGSDATSSPLSWCQTAGSDTPSRGLPR